MGELIRIFFEFWEPTFTEASNGIKSLANDKSMIRALSELGISQF
jgi:hypothetical protein